MSQEQTVKFRKAVFPLTTRHLLSIKIGGKPKVGAYILNREAIPIFAFNCPDHGIVADYPHGYGQKLRCPQCEAEANKKDG